MPEVQLIIQPIIKDKADEKSVKALNSKKDKIVKSIDDLNEIWESISEKLSRLVEKSSVGEGEKFSVEEVEFNIGIEGGLNIGLVTKADASITVKFKKNNVSA